MTAPPSDQLALARRIDAGDEEAFARLVREHHATLLRLALSWTRDPALAEEAVQETWLLALEKLVEFEGRSTLKTWLCGIVINTARSRRRAEQRQGPAPGVALAWSGDGADEPAVAPERFSPPGHRWDGHWQAPPVAWPHTPEGAVLSAELREVLDAFIAVLPQNQRDVLLLRDVEGLSGDEVCNVLGLSSTHQRVLLHRARSRLRGLVEGHYDERANRRKPQS